MEKLTLIDRLQLVKAGYKAKQIEEMIIKDASETSASEEPAENTSKGDAVPEPAKEVGEIPTADEKEDTPDYKQMFEELQKEFDETKKKLDAAQKANTSVNVSGNASIEDSQTKLNNIFRDILN